MFKLILILLLICSSASAQSGVALDAWVRSKDTAENTYNKAEVDAQLGSLVSDLAAGNRLFYCGTETEDIGGIIYGVYSDTNPTEVSTVSIGPIAGTTYAQYSPGRGRISHELGLTNIPAGVYARVSHMANSDSAGRDVSVVYELWRADSAGSKISLIATSSEKIVEGVNDGRVQRVENEFSVATAVALDPTDRLIEEYYFKRSGVTTGTNPTITRYIGGNRAGFLSLALPSAVVMLTDGSNAIATDTRTNISVYSKAEIDAAFAALDVTAILTESGTLTAGETSITTTGDKFAIGTLYLAGAMYDLSDSTQITVDNSGANTVLIIPEALEFDAGWTLTKMTDYSPIIEDILDNILGG